MRYPVLLPLATATCVALAIAARPAPAPLPGPGGVIALHRDLFAAIDAGDTGAVEALMTTVPNGITWRGGEWVDPPGAVFQLLGERDVPSGDTGSAAGAAETLIAWAGEGGETRITEAWADCASAALSFCVMDFERHVEGEPVRRYRSTSLVGHGDGDDWRIYHWHVSPGPDPAQAKKRKAKKSAR